jgi:ATP-dependent RNA helicase RhlE
MGYTEPTPIQAQAIPVILSGRDVIGSAQTGTGKTAAFALPIIQKLWNHRPKSPPRALILEPTRELAAQVIENFDKLGSTVGLKYALLHGGVGYGSQREALSRGSDVIIATPGRLLDHVEERALNLREIEILVLDEVDRMLDMGFMPDVRRIVEMTPRVRQTLLFSATVPQEIDRLANWALKNPEPIAVNRKLSAADTISHYMLPVDDRQKLELLKHLLKQIHHKSVIIFCRTKHGSDGVARKLQKEGHPVAVIHADRSQSERTRALKDFKDGKAQILVATDIAARGLDISSVSHVINYNIPEHAEDYIHRIGRTGRAGAEGDAYSMLTAADVEPLRAIERLLGRSIERKKLEGFEYNWTPLDDIQEKPKPKRRNG